MKASEWRRGVGVVTAGLPQYRQIQFGLVKSDEWIVSGYCVDSSAFTASTFYLQAFAMPRFVPADSLYFDYGFRVNGPWAEVGRELADAVAAAEPKLAEVATLDGLLAAASDWRRNINQGELRLCIAVLKRDEAVFAEAKRATTNFAPEVAWETEVRARCLALATLVEDAGFAAGEAALASRRAEVDRLVT